MAAEQRLTLVGGLSLALEYIDVCERPSVWQGSRASQQDATRFAAEIIALLDPADIYFRWRPTTPDPGDDHILEIALNGAVDAIVTFNTRDFAEAAARFGLRVMKPVDMLRTLEQSNG